MNIERHGFHWIGSAGIPEWLRLRGAQAGANGLTKLGRCIRLLISAIALLSAGGAFAAERLTAAGIDLVVLIDQSGSMSGKGAARGTPPSDPFDMRISFLRNIQHKLVEGAAKGYSNSLTVIEFGGRYATQPAHRPQVTLSRAFPSADMTRPVSQVEREISAALATVQPAFRGDTDHPEALRLAVEKVRELDASPPLPSPNSVRGERKRVVLLVTDGLPSTHAKRAKDEDKHEDNMMPVGTLLKEIEQEARVLRSMATFIVFGLDDGSHYWEQSVPKIGNRSWGAFWREQASRDPKDGVGMAYGTKDASQLARDLEALLLSTLPPQSEAANDDFHWVPPYLRALNLTLTFEQPRVPDASIVLKDPDDRPVALPVATQRWANGLSLQIDHPQPGQWKVRPADAPYRVSVGYRNEDAELIAPQAAVPQHTAGPIRYRLSGRGPGGQFQPVAGFPLRFHAQVTSPSGQRQQFDLDPDAAHPGEVASLRPLALVEEGRYQIEFAGEVVVPGSTSGSRAVYEHRGEIVVSRAQPFHLEVDRPAAGDLVGLFLGRGELPFRARFVDSLSGAPMAPGQVLAPGVVLSALPLLEVGGEPPIARATALEADGDALGASIPLDAGAQRWRLLFNQGQVALFLSAGTSAPFAPGLLFQGVAGGSEWTTPGYGVRESRMTLVLFAGLALLALLAGYLTWPWLIKPRLIAQSDRKAKRRPALRLRFPDAPTFDRRWDLTARHLSRPADTLIHLPNGETWTIEKFRIRRSLTEGGAVRAQVFYRPRTAPNEGRPRKRVRAELRARAEGENNARHRILGLGDIEAWFVLHSHDQESW